MPAVCRSLFFAVFAVFAVLPLLSAAVLCCYSVVVDLKKLGFLRLREVLPLYFPGIISEISERWRRRSRVRARARQHGPDISRCASPPNFASR